MSHRGQGPRAQGPGPGPGPRECARSGPKGPGPGNAGWMQVGCTLDPGPWARHIGHWPGPRANALSAKPRVHSGQVLGPEPWALKLRLPGNSRAQSPGLELWAQDIGSGPRPISNQALNSWARAEGPWALAQGPAILTVSSITLSVKRQL